MPSFRLKGMMDITCMDSFGVKPLDRTDNLKNDHSDLLTVKKVLSGDNDAYAELVQRYHAKVYKLCLYLLSNPTHADDAAQDAFIKAFQSLSKFKGNSSFSTWICRIAYNHCMDLLRTRTRHKTDSWDEMLEKNHEKAERFTPAENDAASISNLDAKLKASLDAIRPEHKEVLLLREVSGLSYDEIAASLRCSLDAVKSRLRRARIELHEKARHYFDQETSIE